MRCKFLSPFLFLTFYIKCVSNFLYLWPSNKVMFSQCGLLEPVRIAREGESGGAVPFHGLQHAEGRQGSSVARPDWHLRRSSCRHHGQTHPQRILSGEFNINFCWFLCCCFFVFDSPLCSGEDLLRQRSGEKAARRGEESCKETDDTEWEAEVGRDVPRNFWQVCNTPPPREINPKPWEKSLEEKNLDEMYHETFA